MNILNLFKKSTVIKDEIKLPFVELNEVIEENRKLLSNVVTWIDDEAFNKSFFQYGVPDYIKTELNKIINNESTYSDYIVFFGRKYFTKVNYFEIGVSVGKNFYQVINGIKVGQFTGFDIEEINPILESKLELTKKNDWQTISNSIKKNNSSFAEYNFQGNKVNYMAADVWDENSWKYLEGNKFNILFSDALHTAEAILFEFEMLVKYNLLDDKFIIIWDDLVGEMQNSYFEIIKKYNKKFSLKERYLVNVNGWVGNNELPHTIGIISNFSFSL